MFFKNRSMASVVGDDLMIVPSLDSELILSMIAAHLSSTCAFIWLLILHVWGLHTYMDTSRVILETGACMRTLKACFRAWNWTSSLEPHSRSLIPTSPKEIKCNKLCKGCCCCFCFNTWGFEVGFACWRVTCHGVKSSQRQEWGVAVAAVAHAGREWVVGSWHLHPSPIPPCRTK